MTGDLLALGVVVVLLAALLGIKDHEIQGLRAEVRVARQLAAWDDDA